MEVDSGDDCEVIENIDVKMDSKGEYFEFVKEETSEEIKTDVVSAIVAGTILISTHSSILHYVTFHILFAVIVLHIALGMYIVKAYRGETDTKQQMGKRD